MKILSRYILRESVVFFTVALFAFTGVLLTIRMLQFATLIINKGVSFSQIGGVFIAIVPTFLEIALPMSGLLAVMLAFARMSGDSEIIVIRANGIALHQLLRPILLFGVLLALITMYVAVYLRPWGNAVLERSLFDIARSKSTAGLYAGVFNKLGPIMLYAEYVNDRTGALEKVLIDDKRDELSRKLVIAERGTITSDVDEKNIIIRLQDGDIHEETDKGYVITEFNTNNLVLNMDQLFVGEESTKDKKGREMYINELRDSAARYTDILNHLKANNNDFSTLAPDVQKHLENEALDTSSDVKRRIRRLQIEGWRRFSMPYASFILALLAMPLGVVPPRTHKSWGAGLSVALGLIVFTIYYVLLSVGITLAESGKIDPLLGLWIPNLIATGVAIYVIFMISVERWGSVSDGLEKVLKKIARPFKKLRGAA